LLLISKLLIAFALGKHQPNLMHSIIADYSDLWWFPFACLKSNQKGKHL